MTSSAAARVRRLPARTASSARTGRTRTARTLVAVLAVAAVSTAAAPSVITVQPGDTLWGLARTHGTSVSELQRLNGLDGSGTIYAGRSLTVSAGGGGSTGGGRTHTVVAGDTLSQLAVTYGTSARALGEANGLASSGLIRIGATLTVPGGGGPAAETSNAGVTIPDRVRTSVAQNRATLAARSQPSKAAVQDLVAATARAQGVDPSLAMAVAFHESGFQQRVVSPVNAIGVMQVLPSTGEDVSRSIGRDLDLLDARDNITAGVVFLKQLLRSTGSTDAALAGYYQGLGSVAKRGRLPQTDAYLANIRALRSRFGG